MTQITYPSGHIVNYTYDSQGRISGVTTQANSTAPVVTLASNVTYKPFGPLKSFTYGNGLVMTRSFDADYRHHRHHHPEQPPASVQSLNLSYDADG